jgi:hypothetical protein
MKLVDSHRYFFLATRINKNSFFLTNTKLKHNFMKLRTFFHPPCRYFFFTTLRHVYVAPSHLVVMAEDAGVAGGAVHLPEPVGQEVVAVEFGVGQHGGAGGAGGGEARELQPRLLSLTLQPPLHVPLDLNEPIEM